MSGSLCWLSFNSYYFSAWPIHHLECFLIYCGIMLTAVPWMMWAWNGDTRMCFQWQEQNLFLLCSTAGFVEGKGHLLKSCRNFLCVPAAFIPSFKNDFSNINESASGGAGPAEGECLNLCLFAFCCCWEVQSPELLGWEFGCGKESSWNSWPGTAGTALPAQTGRAKLCSSMPCARGAAGLGVAPVVQAMLLAIKLLFSQWFFCTRYKRDFLEASRLICLWFQQWSVEFNTY